MFEDIINRLRMSQNIFFKNKNEKYYFRYRYNKSNIIKKLYRYNKNIKKYYFLYIFKQEIK